MASSSSQSPRALFLLALAFAAAFCLCCLPRLGSPGLNEDEAMQGAEAVLFLRRWQGKAQEAPVNIGAITSDAWAFHRFPWMTMPYLGALKTYILALAFAVFGAGAASLRMTTVFLGAVAVFCTTLFVGRRYGYGWAAAAGAWLATDPALILMARHDSGPFILGIALKMGGIAALEAGFALESDALLVLGGGLFGLALWDKAHFLWFLFGGVAAAALWWDKRAWRALPWAAGGFLLGAAPWIAFNITYPWRTFASQPALAADRISEFFTSPAASAASRWSYFTAAMSGKGFSTLVGDPVLTWPFPRLLLGCAALLAALAFVSWLKRGAKVRDPAFWFTLAAATFLACLLTPMRVYMHHMPMLYPFPHLAFLSLLAAGLSGLGRRAWTAPLVVFFAAAVLQNLIVVARLQHYLDLGGGQNWYVGVRDLDAYCERRGGPVVSMLGWFTSPLVVYSGGRILPYEGYGDMDTPDSFQRSLQKPPGYLSRPGTLILVSETPSQNPLPGLLLSRLAKDPALGLAKVYDVPYSDGRPWAEVYRVNGGAPL